MLKLAESYKEIHHLNATKDKFFSIIAHDLRSPFTAILGFSELLKKRSKSYSPEEVEHIAIGLNSVSKQTYELLENLLEWSKSQRNQITFNPEKIDFKKFVEEEITKIEYSAKNKEIQLLHNIPNNVYIHADLNMLKTILRNLISNSIKFTNKNGVVNIQSIENEKFTEICVKDNGVGMNKEQREKLFKIEENVSTYGTNKEKGSGLGLILCKEFVEKHRGEIWVESEEEQGSCFSFTIPSL